MNLCMANFEVLFSIDIDFSRDETLLLCFDLATKNNTTARIEHRKLQWAEKNSIRMYQANKKIINKFCKQ